MTRDPEHWLRLFAANCAFVLLLVFIVIMTMKPLFGPAPLFFDPIESTTATRSPEEYGDLIVTIANDDRFFFFDAGIELSQLHSRIIRAKTGSDEDPALFVRVGRGVSFGAVRTVIRAAQDAGYTRVTFLFQVREAEAPVEDDSPNRWSLAPASQRRTIVGAIAFAVLSFLAAVAITAWRPRRSHRPGRVIWLLLFAAVLALVFAWDELRHACPPNVWC